MSEPTHPDLTRCSKILKSEAQALTRSPTNPSRHPVNISTVQYFALVNQHRICPVILRHSLRGALAAKEILPDVSSVRFGALTCKDSKLSRQCAANRRFIVPALRGVSRTQETLEAQAFRWNLTCCFQRQVKQQTANPQPWSNTPGTLSDRLFWARATACSQTELATSAVTVRSSKLRTNWLEEPSMACLSTTGV